MQQRTLGRNGLIVPAIGFGCASLSSAYGPSDDKVSVNTIRHAIDSGTTCSTPRTLMAMDITKPSSGARSRSDSSQRSSSAWSARFRPALPRVPATPKNRWETWGSKPASAQDYVAASRQGFDLTIAITVFLEDFARVFTKQGRASTDTGRCA